MIILSGLTRFFDMLSNEIIELKVPNLHDNNRKLG